jgi:Mg2+ and Co2+ transporter CorA
MALESPTSTPAHADTRPVRAMEWLPGHAPRAIALADVAGSSGVVCIEVLAGSDASDVHMAVSPICGPGLTPAMIDELLDPDELPKIRDYDETGIRAVSAFAVTAHDPTEANGDGAKTGTLTFELVEFVASERWIIACCHRAQSYVDAGHSSVADRAGCRSVFAAAAKRWVAGDYATAGDLGVLLLHELTCSYSPARRQLYSWLEAWELNFYKTDFGDQADVSDRDALVRLRGLVAEFRARLNAINVPQDEADKLWFAGVTQAQIAQRADRHIDRSLASLEKLSDMVRGGFDLIQSQATARQLVLAQEQKDASERFQRRVETIGAVFLVPTLIAGIWGENTWVPGQGKSWGFLLTAAVMVAASGLVLILLHFARKNPHRPVSAKEAR